MDGSVLITGASGFLGRHAIAALMQEGRMVTALCRRPVAGVVSISADLTTAAFTLPPVKYDTVFHFAGLAHLVPQTQPDAHQFHEVNVGGTRRLLSALQHPLSKPRAIVLISTVAVYGKNRGDFLGESTPRAASDPYGRSKIETEDAVDEWCRHNKVGLTILRLPLVTGTGAPGNLRSMVAGIRHGYYFGVGDGSARRSMVRAGDVGKVLSKASTIHGAFHLTDGCHPTFAELEQGLAVVLGRHPPRRVPLRIARALGYMGDMIQKFTRKRFFLTSQTIDKMSNSLTFSDEAACAALGWSPTRVVDHLNEICE